MWLVSHNLKGLPRWHLGVKNPPSNTGDIRDASSIPGLGRPPGGRYGHPLQYSCLENHMHRGAWWATVHGIAKSWTWLNQLSTHPSTHTQFKDRMQDLPQFRVRLKSLLLTTMLYCFLYRERGTVQRKSGAELLLCKCDPPNGAAVLGSSLSCLSDLLSLLRAIASSQRIKQQPCIRLIGTEWSLLFQNCPLHLGRYLCFSQIGECPEALPWIEMHRPFSWILRGQLHKCLK